MSADTWGNRHARLSMECRRQRLERRYRRLLVLYPKEHRRQHADEMVGVLLASALDAGPSPKPGDVAGDLGQRARLGHLADIADLVGGGFRIRARTTIRPG
jgi:hypothetical protein